MLYQMILFAILNRWRGSGKFGSKGIKQVIMGMVLGLFLYMNDVSIVRAIICGLIFIPLIAMGWGMVFDLGRGTLDPKRWKGWYLILPMEQPDWTFKQKWIVDFCGLSLRGAMITIPIGLISGLYWYCFIGFLMPVCYEIGWQCKERLKIKDPIRIGELIFGGMLGKL